MVGARSGSACSLWLASTFFSCGASRPIGFHAVREYTTLLPMSFGHLTGRGGVPAEPTGARYSMPPCESSSAPGTCVENKAAQPSASGLSGGFSQRQVVPQTARSFGRPRPIS